MRLPGSTLCTLITAGCLAAPVAGAQTYPVKPVRIVAADAGGSSDFSTRVIAPYLASGLGQQMVIENRGGSAVIAIEAVAKAPPDGYTLLVFGSTLWVLPMMQQTNYSALKDFAPITLVNRSPNILVVHPSLPVTSVRELIALAKARPGELNYASTIVGSATHLAAELFKSMASVNIVRVPYKGAGAAITDLIGGHVQIMFASAGAMAPHITSKRLRALAVTSAEPSIVMPGVPSIAAAGLPGYESQSLIAMFAPAGTPAAIISRVHQETAAALQRPEVKEKYLGAGVEAVGNTPDQFLAVMQSEIARMGKMIKAAGIRID